MNGILPVSKIAEAIAAFGLLPWEFQNPTAGSLGHLQKPLVLSELIALKIGVTNQRSPDDDRVVLGIITSTGGVVEGVAPTMMFEAGNFPLIQPIQTAHCLPKIRFLFGCPV